MNATFTITVKLDGVPGWGYTAEDWAYRFNNLIESYYKPKNMQRCVTFVGCSDEVTGEPIDADGRGATMEPPSSPEWQATYDALIKARQAYFASHLDNEFECNAAREAWEAASRAHHYPQDHGIIGDDEPEHKACSDPCKQCDTDWRGNHPYADRCWDCGTANVVPGSKSCGDCLADEAAALELLTPQ